MTTGYAHAEYAASLQEFGNPRLLPQCDGWLLERTIGNTGFRDAMGAYPLFSCADWSGLPQDLASLGSELVSVVLVADPFGNHDPGLLGRTFNRGAVPFKEHHIVDLTKPLETAISSHHRRNIRKAIRVVDAERIVDPATSLDDWVRLYGTLIERHSIDGISAFSRASFMRQLVVPGVMAYRATHGGVTVGMLLFYVQGDVAYYHLGAYSDRGYELGAAFAVFWVALRDLASTVRFVSLGGDAGVDGEAGGLGRFKRGWASGTRQAFLCRHVGDPGRYAELSARATETTFFPAYRGSAPRQETAVAMFGPP